MHRKYSITALEKTGVLYLVIFSLSVLALPHSYGFEFTGERWRDNIPYHWMESCPAYILPAIEKAFESVSPVMFKNSGIKKSVGFDYKVTFYCADTPYKNQQKIPLTVELEETNFETEEQTIGATTRRYWLPDTLQIIDFDIWLNLSVINSSNINKILSHEILHGLGLRHSANPEALMYFVPSQSEMHADDLAAVSLLYGVCEDSVDEQFNYFMHKVPVDGKNYYGILPSGGVWPKDVHTIGISVC